jgi:hypothetical protein
MLSACGRACAPVLAHQSPADHDSGIVVETGAFIVARQVDGDGFVACTVQQRHHSMPVPGASAGSGNEDERAHVDSSSSDDAP